MYFKNTRFHDISVIASNAGYTLYADAYDDGTGYRLNDKASGFCVGYFRVLDDVLDYLRTSQGKISVMAA